MNGVDGTEVIGTGSCHIEVIANDVGKSDMIESGSGHVRVKKKNVNRPRDDGKVAVKLCKKTFVFSNEADGHSDTIEACSFTSQCANGQHCQINISVDETEGARSKSVDVTRVTIGQTVRSTDDVKLVSARSTETQSSSTDKCIAPTDCDLHTANNESVSTDADSVGSQFALSSPSSAKTKLTDDLSVRTKNRGSEIIVAGNHCEGSETGSERQPISRDLPSVHKECSEADRQKLLGLRHCSQLLANCQLISAKLMSDSLPTVVNEGSETDRQRRHGNCQLPTVCDNSGETDQDTNCRLTSDNSPKTHSVGSETDCLLPKVECRGGETERSRRHVNCELASVHKRQMLVDCDVNVPHNIWTTVVNHNSSTSDDDSSAALSHTANKVRRHVT